MTMRAKPKPFRVIAGSIIAVLGGVNIIVSGVSVNGEANSPLKGLVFAGGMALLVSGLYSTRKEVVIAVAVAVAVFFGIRPLLEHAGLVH